MLENGFEKRGLRHSSRKPETCLASYRRRHELPLAVLCDGCPVPANPAQAAKPQAARKMGKSFEIVRQLLALSERTRVQMAIHGPGAACLPPPPAHTGTRAATSIPARRFRSRRTLRPRCPRGLRRASRPGDCVIHEALPAMPRSTIHTSDDRFAVCRPRLHTKPWITESVAQATRLAGLNYGTHPGSGRPHRNEYGRAHRQRPIRIAKPVSEVSTLSHKVGRSPDLQLAGRDNGEGRAIVP